LEKFLKYKILSLVFLVSVLFTQVAVNYFHHHTEKPSSELSIDVTGEKCKICAIDLYLEVFFQDTPRFVFPHNYVQIKENVSSTLVIKIVSFKPGRAPPAFFLIPAC